MSETVIIIEEIENNFDKHITTLVERIEIVSKECKTILIELKGLKKEHSRLIKKASGGRRKKTPKDVNAPKKAPSGFAKPTQISTELADFLELKEGDMIARPQAIKRVSEYIKKHNLQDEKDGRKIHLERDGGDVLAKLLNVTRNTELTYFNLQTYMKSHFPKSKIISEEKPKRISRKKISEADKPAEA